MKKTSITTLAIVLSLLSFAQTKTPQTKLKMGIHVGFPVGDATDISSLNLGIDALYLFWKPINDLQIGASTGYSHFFGKDGNIK